MTGATAARDGDATRARVLDAAAELFAKKGLDGVRLREIAERADATVPLVCFHFRDKETLYAAAIDHGLARFASIGWAVLGGRGTFVQRLEKLVGGLIDLLAREPVITALVHRELADGGARAKPIAERWLVPLRRASGVEIRAAQARGEVRAELDADLALMHIVAAVVYPAVAAPIVKAVWHEDPLSARGMARRKRELVALLVAGLGVTAPKRAVAKKRAR